MEAEVIKLLLALLLLPIAQSGSRVAPDSWVTVTTLMLFVGSEATLSYSFAWVGMNAEPIEMPQKLSNWSCRRSGYEHDGEVTSYVECRQGKATVVIDVTCQADAADADLGSAIVLNKARNYGGRFVITCVTRHETGL